MIAQQGERHRRPVLVFDASASPNTTPVATSYASAAAISG